MTTLDTPAQPIRLADPQPAPIRLTPADQPAQPIRLAGPASEQQPIRLVAPGIAPRVLSPTPGAESPDYAQLRQNADQSLSQFQQANQPEGLYEQLGSDIYHAGAAAKDLTVGMAHSAHELAVNNPLVNSLRDIKNVHVTPMGIERGRPVASDTPAVVAPIRQARDEAAQAAGENLQQIEHSPVLKTTAQMLPGTAAMVGGGLVGGPAGAVAGALATQVPQLYDAVDRRLRAEGYTPQESHAKALEVVALAAPFIGAGAAATPGAGAGLVKGVATDVGIMQGQNLATQAVDYGVTGEPIHPIEGLKEAPGQALVSTVMRGAHAAIAGDLGKAEPGLSRAQPPDSPPASPRGVPEPQPATPPAPLRPASEIQQAMPPGDSVKPAPDVGMSLEAQKWADRAAATPVRPSPGEEGAVRARDLERQRQDELDRQAEAEIAQAALEKFNQGKIGHPHDPEQLARFPQFLPEGIDMPGRGIVRVDPNATPAQQQQALIDQAKVAPETARQLIQQWEAARGQREGNPTQERDLAGGPRVPGTSSAAGQRVDEPGAVRPLEKGVQPLVADQGAPAGNQPGDVGAVNRRPIWEMSPQELQRQIQIENSHWQGLDERLLGPEGAKRYRKLERAANATVYTPEGERRQAEAQAEMDRMIEALPKAQQDEFFGINQPNRPDVEQLKEMQRSIEHLDFDSEEALGQSLRWAITDVGEKSDPTQMTPREQIAYGTIRAAMEGMQQRGMNEAKVMEAAVRASAARFRDPNDAEFMLRRFFKWAGENPAQQEAPRPPGLPQNPAVRELPDQTQPAAAETVQRRPSINERLPMDNLRKRLQDRISAGGTVQSKYLERFRGEPWADEILAARAPRPQPAEDSMGRRRGELEQQLRNQVAIELGADRVLEGKPDALKLQVLRGDAAPGTALPLDQAIQHASELPADHPARITLHNLQELEQNPRGTKVQRVNTSSVADGTRVVVNDKETLTVDREEGVVKDGITVPIPEGGIDLYGKQILPPDEHAGPIEAAEPAGAQAGGGRVRGPGVRIPPGQRRNAGMIALPDIGPVVERLHKAAKQVRDFFDLEGVPVLSRMGAGPEAVTHAFAREAPKYMAAQKVAQVFDQGDYHKPDVMAMTMKALNYDNILGGYDQLKAKADALDARASDAKTKRAELSDQIAAETNARKKRELQIELGKEAREQRRAAVRASAARKRVLAIQDEQDLAGMDAFVRVAAQDPAVQRHVRNWKQFVEPEGNEWYNRLKALDPETEHDTRGRHLGARVNLLAVDPETGEPLSGLKAMPAGTTPTGGGNLKAPNVKKDPYARVAKLTGTYSENPQQVLEAMIGRRWNEVSKLDLYDALEKNRVAVLQKSVKGKLSAAPENIGGEEVRALPVKVPRTTKGGGTVFEERQLWIRKSAYREVRDVLNTDMSNANHPAAKLLTGIQMLSGVDAVAHSFNQLRLAANAPGRGPIADIVQKIPVFGQARGIYDMARTVHEVLTDGPGVRADLDEMARKGYLRKHFPPTGVQKITGVQEFIHRNDTAIRLLLLRQFRNLAARGMANPADERVFVNQIGQYNARLMGPLANYARQSGLSPFLVAGRHFNRQAARYLTGNPGFSSPTWKAAAQARLTQLALPLAAAAIPALINFIRVGRAGGRPGVPIGAIDTGENDRNGKPVVIDLMQLTGSRRGMRLTGINSLIEGLRQGKDANTILGNMEQESAQTLLHPYIGPAPAFVYKGLTGMQPDLRGTMEARRVPEGGIAQTAENFRAAAESQNPLMYETGKSVWDLAHGELPEAGRIGDIAGAAGGKAVLSAAGIKAVPLPSSAAADLARELAYGADAHQMTAEEADVAQQKRQLLAQLKADPVAGRTAVERAVADGDVTERQAALLIQRSGMSDLAWALRSVPARDVRKVWAKMTDQEKQDNRAAVYAKLRNAKQDASDFIAR